MRNVVINTSEIYERLKKVLNLRNDAELARVLKEPPKKLAVWKTRNTVPYEILVSFCGTKGLRLEWVLTGEGEEFETVGGIIQTATGNGHVQVGGKIETGAGARIGGVHIGREVITVEEGQAIWQSNDRDLVELIALLRDYGTPKMLAELRDKLLQVKKAVEGG